MQNGATGQSSAKSPVPSLVSSKILTPKKIRSNHHPAAPAKRDLPERPDWIIEQLVIQALNSGVTAEELCGSDTSWGPDYIGSDLKFCDMSDKVVYPFCELEDFEGCMEFDDTNLSITKRSSVARRSVKTHHKSYKVIKKAKDHR